MSFNVHSVAIIGAGPSGLATAKYLEEQGGFDRIVVFERQHEVGGVWNYSAQPAAEDHLPQESPFCPIDPPIREDKAKSTHPHFATPMYDFLHTNIPHELMRYSDLSFVSVYESDPERVKRQGPLVVFPRRELVQEYLVHYAKEIRSQIRFGRNVDAVTRWVDPETKQDRWKVQTSEVGEAEEKANNNNKTETDTFDAVVVACGHYETPYVPNIDGLKAFVAAHPGVVTHSKRYRRPETFADKKVLVIGNAASGLDIALQINSKSQRPLFLSGRQPTPAANLRRIEGCVDAGEVSAFLPETRGVRFADGKIETGFDAVVFCTGFLYSLPFFEREHRLTHMRVASVDGDNEQGTTSLDSLLTDGLRIRGLYEDMLLIKHPTLAFVGVPVRVVPFPLAESQAALLARIWSNRLPLPPTSTMRLWESEAQKDRPATSFHTWQLGEEGPFINNTYDRIMNDATARPGKVPPRWNEERMWERLISMEAKGVFEDTGRKATSLEELGYTFEKCEGK